MRKRAEDECACGGFACFHKYTDRGKVFWRVYCTKCGRQSSPHEKAEEAFKEWKKQEELYSRWE